MSDPRTEAALLVDAVLERLGGVRAALPDGTAEPPPACPTCGHRAGAECRGCPWCTVLAVVRGERPELAAGVLDGVIAVLTTLRDAVGPQAPTAPTDPAHATAPGGAAPDDTDPAADAAGTATRSGARTPDDRARDDPAPDDRASAAAPRRTERIRIQ